MAKELLDPSGEIGSPAVVIGYVKIISSADTLVSAQA